MNLEKIVYNYPVKYIRGFTNEEITEFLKQFPSCNMKRFNDAMRGNTCMIIDGKIINYHIDVLNALTCGLEDRDLLPHEFD